MQNVSVEEQWVGIVNRVTYHNPANGWSVLRVQPLGQVNAQETVTVHQTKVFAGATMEFSGAWSIDSKFGRQFKANRAIEKKPASASALEKYLGSGLIKGVGPKTAKKIVKHFQSETLDIFENQIDRLTEVPGIASKKLVRIEQAWAEHSAIRDVMIFLQEHGISTLFAVRIYQAYGDESIQRVKANPYCLADDFYGIGFFSADRVALSMDIPENSPVRVRAAIKHVLSASREEGHCYLTLTQILSGIAELISLDLAEELPKYLEEMIQEDQLCMRELIIEGNRVPGYYSKSLYFAELNVAESLKKYAIPKDEDTERIKKWVTKYCEHHEIKLSEEQAQSVIGIVHNQVSILTGGPGCGKTTTTLVIVRLLEAMKKRVTLVAPTGRAAQRMSEVIGREAKTIHRLLEWKGGEFQVNEKSPLKTDYLIIDECSMLDISLASSVMKAVPEGCGMLFIGDADQLPSVGAGNVLKDMIASRRVPCYRLTQVFRQARASLIIRYAHQINQGKIPMVNSPFKSPSAWQDGTDCLFLDSDEATKEQLSFIKRVKSHFQHIEDREALADDENLFEFRQNEALTSAYEAEFEVPKKFQHVDIQNVQKASTDFEAFKAVLKKVHPWSSVHFGLTAVDVVVKLALHWIPKYIGQNTEVQILTPMTRGSLGTANLNAVMQQSANAPSPTKPQISIGQRVLRVGDRVIHRKNNYDLHVYNGDIGRIIDINTEDVTCTVCFYPDNRSVNYKREDMMELDLAYAITIHKSQGSEFGAVIIPVLTQHFKMLYRNLIYTGLTRAKKFAAFVGTRRALAMAIRNQDTSQRQTALVELLSEGVVATLANKSENLQSEESENCEAS